MGINDLRLSIHTYIHIYVYNSLHSPHNPYISAHPAYAACTWPKSFLVPPPPLFHLFFFKKKNPTVNGYMYNYITITIAIVNSNSQ